MYSHLKNAELHKGENPTAGMRFRNKETARDRYVTDAELDKPVGESSSRFGICCSSLTSPACGS